MTPEQKWHWEQGIKFAHEGIKVLLTLNGGGALALITFAAHVATPLAVSRVGYSLLAFGAGALLAAVVFICAYLTQLEYGNDAWSKATSYHCCAYILVGGSLLAFLVGLGFAYMALPTTS